MNEFGKVSCVQFEDKAKESAFHLRTHYREILRSKEALAKLASLKDLMKRYDMDISAIDSNVELETYLA